MSYLLAKHVLLRSPVKSPADYNEGNQFFLDDPDFRSALYLASASFHDILEQRLFQSENLSEKETNTLRKYINRYCFRPTPFGLFSSVSLIQWKNAAAIKSAVKTFEITVCADQSYQAMLAKALLSSRTGRAGSYEANPSIYRVLNEYRFFRTDLDETFRQREYLLQSIAFSKLLKDLIYFCQEKQKLNDVVSFIVKDAICSLEEAHSYADFLVDAQLLVSTLRPNITGTDYVERLTGHAVLPETVAGGYSKLFETNLGNLVPAALKPVNLQQLSFRLEQLLPPGFTHFNTDRLNVILHRELITPFINQSHMQQLRDGIYALEKLSAIESLPAMDDFITNYQLHFAGQSLPLLLALDPEAGIGYQMQYQEKNTPLLETLHLPPKFNDKVGVRWSEIHSLLMGQWLRSTQAGESVIELTESALKDLTPNGATCSITGFSVLFRITGGKMSIENAGGVNAPALLGRFTIADEKIHAAAEEMAIYLEEQNPDIIFAELLHLADPHVDNINRRKSIYHYELPITAMSVLPENRQLALSDLHIRIENNRVVLYSAKHQKIVIPRLTSAYNHSLDRLPLFRFLADIPYQYSRFNLSFDLRLFFPGLPFYPRVTFKETILSLATWIIRGDQLADLQNSDPKGAAIAFRKYTDANQLPAQFSLTEGDRQLVFNHTIETDLLFFLSCIRKKGEIVLQEFLLQQEIRQYNAFILPDKPLNFPVLRKNQQEKPAGPKTKRKFMPGTEWLYFKIYLPKIGSGRLLLRLEPLLHKRYPHGQIKKWFFIRYEDHAPHIRLRLQVVPEDISEVVIAFKSRLENHIRQYVIREYQIDVYSRELERYRRWGD